MTGKHTGSLPVVAALTAVLLFLVTGRANAEYLFTQLRPPIGHTTNSTAYGINNAGAMVGDYYQFDTLGIQGFLYSGGNYTTLQVPAPGSRVTEAFGLNDAGQIVGAYQDSGSAMRGFLYSSGSYTTLDQLTSPRGINNSGQIVGGPGLLFGADFTRIDVPGAKPTSLWYTWKKNG